MPTAQLLANTPAKSQPSPFKKLPQFRIAEFAIDEKHQAFGGDAGLLGAAIENVKPCPDGVGFFRRYKIGMIYWSPTTGAHEIHGDILAKWSSLGFERSFLGYPIEDEKGTPDGRGRFNRFRGGMIYWTRSTGAHEIHGDILGKWSKLGFESGLGYPLTDETVTPDGIGRFNRFERGMVYWTPDTGAFEIHGDILAKWSALGFERSWLGYPTSDESDYEGGRINTFERGAIYWWPDTGAIDLNDVAVQYTGLICFGETDNDGLSGADEPYAIFGVIEPTRTSTVRTPIYGDVDAGESRPDLIQLYRGKPRGLGVSVLLMEHDDDNPDKYTAVMQNAVNQVFHGATTLVTFIPVVGPIIAAIARPILDLVAPDIGEAISHLFGTDDDILGTVTLQITPKQMVVLAGRTGNSNEKGVGFKLTTPILGGAQGATYKVYFGLNPV